MDKEQQNKLREEWNSLNPQETVEKLLCDKNMNGDQREEIADWWLSKFSTFLQERAELARGKKKICDKCKILNEKCIECLFGKIAKTPMTLM